MAQLERSPRGGPRAGRSAAPNGHVTDPLPRSSPPDGPAAGPDPFGSPAAGPDPFARPAGFAEPFRLPGFRWTWLCILLFASGRFGLVLVGGREAFAVTGSAMWSSMIMMFLMAPVLLLGPFAGAMADRHRRTVLMAISLAIAIVGCALGAAVSGSSGVRLGVVVGGSLLVGVAGTLFTPAWQAMIPEVLGSRRLLAGGAFTRIAGQGGEFVGPAIGTPILLAFGPRVGFAYCAAMFLGALAITPILARVEPVSDRAPERVLARVAEGVRYIVGHRRVGALLLLTALHCALTMGFLGLLPGLAAHHLAAPDAYGPVVTALGLGAIVGALALAIVAARSITAPALVVSGIASGAFLVWLGLAATIGGALVAAFFAGAAQSTFMAASYSAVQTITRTRFRGRVASVSIMMTMGSMGVLGMGWAALADRWSASSVLAVLGAAFLIVMAAFLVGFRPLRTRHGLDLPGAAALGT